MKKLLLSALMLSGLFTQGQQRPQPNPALDSLKNEKDTLVLNKKIEKLRAGSESDLSLLLNYYNSANQKKAEELVDYTIKRFPEGNLAKVMATNAIYSQQDPVKQESLAKAFKAKYPKDKTDMIDYAVAYGYIDKKNTPKALEYLDKITDPVFKPQAVGIIAKPLMEYDINTAERIVKDGLEKAKGLATNPASIERAKTDKLYNPNAAYYNYIVLYSDILTKKGNYKEALSYIKEVFDNSTKKSAALSKSYFVLMSRNGYYRESFDELEKIAAAGQADDLVKEELKKSYTALNPGKDANAFMAGFSTQLDKRAQEEALKMMINEKAPNFIVTDENGKQVSLADFKGKTIVLDFWATWCGPCKASFPAMQKLVNKYKNDSQVKFLFIHTWERSATPKKDALDYLSANKFDMDLYMDVKDLKTKSNPAVSAFKVMGIPAKFVIDASGNTRFKLTGFSGGDDAAVAEVSAMINLAKQSKS